MNKECIQQTHRYIQYIWGKKTNDQQKTVLSNDQIYI